MRALLVAGVAVVASITPALAAVLAPNEIQATFFTGQPFTVVDAVECQVQDGVHRRRQDDARAGGQDGGAKGEGTWKLTKDGFCTTWKGSKANCFRILTAGDNKWSVMKGTTAVATWTK